MIHREMLIGGHFIGGPCDQSIGKAVVRSPYDGSLVGTAAEGGLDEAMAAVDAAHTAFTDYSHSSPAERTRLLEKIAQAVRDREEELAELLTLEVAKPIAWSRAEVARMAITFDLAAKAVAGFGHEELRLDFDPRGEGYTCVVERFPIGPVFCIVPYNWPFNLAAHKIAPALAVGNTVVLKPSDLAPLSTLTLARIIHEAGCPYGVVNAILIPPEAAEKALRDPRVKMLSFTGSPAVGWHLKSLVNDKKVTLELGGNASAIVCNDADLDWATTRLTAGGYGYGGQICISIQHVLVESGLYSEMRERLIESTRACPTGDPRLETTVCGPMISQAAADKVMSFVDEAVSAGARVIAGGAREGNLIAPTLLENVPHDVRLSNEEVFGPVLTIEPFTKFEEAIARVNSSQYGIQCGLFTKDRSRAEMAFREIEVGGLIVNDYPTLRFDNYPYGGVKRSGFGREGVRYAMEEMTEPKVMVSRGL